MLKRAKGLVIITRICGGFIHVGGGFGSGIMLRRLDETHWSGPVSVNTISLNMGLMMGMRKSDTLLCLLDDAAINVSATPGGHTDCPVMTLGLHDRMHADGMTECMLTVR